MSAHRRPTSGGHTLPHPKHPINPLRDPFVGNRSVNDNLHEMVEIAVWKALGSKARQLEIAVSNRTIELRGTLDAEKDRLAAVEAAQSTAGVLSVVSRIGLNPASVNAAGTTIPEPTRMVTLRHFCAADEASTSAAIRQAVDRLDELTSNMESRPQRLFIVYSNLLPHTVTLDVGIPVSELAELPVTGELHVEPIPTGTDIHAECEAGFEGLAAACADLSRRSTSGDRHPHHVFWQVFDAEEFRPWTGHPRAEVYLAD